ncbi:MAG: hypothetical protein H6661_07020 [Ardenticatenaceae bacterium]|nr:hypothetical protein [Ardenticatenaceae bacterium]
MAWAVWPIATPANGGGAGASLMQIADHDDVLVLRPQFGCGVTFVFRQAVGFHLGHPLRRTFLRCPGHCRRSA